MVCIILGLYYFFKYDIAGDGSYENSVVKQSIEINLFIKL